MSTCSRCGAEFTCGMADAAADEPCWCAQLPPLPRSSYVVPNEANDNARCFCPQCLHDQIALQQKNHQNAG